ncbi:MAG: DnaJ domain-containing protein [Planctomycetes bacterium]|nr:DnaJ domain-containing protein [Planctomycetota bacterium]
MTHEDPRAILGVSAEAGEEEIRAAYLRKVKEHPPERSPLKFERIRDAYETLRDPRKRARLAFLAEDPLRPLPSLLEGIKTARLFVGPEPWLEVLRKK